MGVLAVKVDEFRPRFTKRAYRNRPPINVGPGTPGPRNDTSQNLLLLAKYETPVNSSFLSTGPNKNRIGFAPKEQLDRLDEESLSGAGLTRKRRQTRPEDNRGIADHAEVCYNKFMEHDGSASPSVEASLWISTRRLVARRSLRQIVRDLVFQVRAVRTSTSECRGSLEDQT